MYILLYCFWLLLCGKLTAEVCLIGIAVVLLVAVVESFLFGYTPKKEAAIMRRAFWFLLYCCVLFVEILKAAFVVSRDILLRRYRVSPTLVTFRVGLKTEFGKYLLANSITLTPGTITINVDGDRFTVHCLDKSMLDISENSTFQRWIRKLEE